MISIGYNYFSILARLAHRLHYHMVTSAIMPSQTPKNGGQNMKIDFDLVKSAIALTLNVAEFDKIELVEFDDQEEEIRLLDAEEKVLYKTSY
jgi:hypothetical protein